MTCLMILGNKIVLPLSYLHSQTIKTSPHTLTKKKFVSLYEKALAFTLTCTLFFVAKTALGLYSNISW